MRIVLDIDKLLEQDQITEAQYERLKQNARIETGTLAFNILVGFGVIATTGGALALFPTALTAIVVGFVLAFLGFFVASLAHREWGVLGAMISMVGSTTLIGGIIAYTEGHISGYLTVSLLGAVAAILTKSNLLAIMTCLSLLPTVGAMFSYGFATYMLTIRQPSVTVIVFSLLAWASYRLSKQLPADYEQILITFSRTSLFVVNLGFWVGSLWGDSFASQEDDWTFRSGTIIPDWVFVIGWAIGLIATGTWAARNSRRWVVNLLTVFGAIHFYTQYFERLEGTPMSILVAGLITIAIAFSLAKYNGIPRSPKYQDVNVNAG